MATNKFEALQDMSDSDLQNELKDISERYHKLKFDHAIKGLDNPIALREIRRDIARLNTEIRRREMATYSNEQLAQRSKIRSRRKLNT